MSSTAAIAAAAAAAREAMLRQEEEETMTDYEPRDLAQDWEFKILRSSSAAFRDPAVQQQACDEESWAGWILVEKFDNSRLRFKRPASAKLNDASSSLDPYRTVYGMSEGWLAFLICTLVIAVIIFAIALLIPR